MYCIARNVINSTWPATLMSSAVKEWSALLGGARKSPKEIQVAYIFSLFLTSRNEEAINSTRNRINSLKVYNFLLYRRRYFLLVSELI